MSGIFAALFILSSCVSLLIPTVVVIALALTLLLPSHTGSFDALSLIIGVAVCAAIPAAAFLAARLVRPLTDRGSTRSSALELLAVVLAVTVALQDGGIAAAAVQVLLSGAVVKVGALSLIISRVIMCAAAVALVLSCVCVISELFVVWCARAVCVRYPFSQDALRQLLLLVASAAGIDLIVGLCSKELAPLSLLQGFVP